MKTFHLTTPCDSCPNNLRRRNNEIPERQIKLLNTKMKSLLFAKDRKEKKELLNDYKYDRETFEESIHLNWITPDKKTCARCLLDRDESKYRVIYNKLVNDIINSIPKKDLELFKMDDLKCYKCNETKNQEDFHNKRRICKKCYSNSIKRIDLNENKEEIESIKELLKSTTITKERRDELNQNLSNEMAEINKYFNDRKYWYINEKTTKKYKEYIKKYKDDHKDEIQYYQQTYYTNNKDNTKLKEQRKAARKKYKEQKNKNMTDEQRKEMNRIRRERRQAKKQLQQEETQ